MTVTTSKSLIGLADRLTNAEDRERYVSLLLYLESLPPDDEFRQLAEIMGLLSLLGQRVPDALAAAMTELRQLTDRAGAYYGEIDERLAGLPGAITTGVDTAGLAKEMAELFRQQLSAAGLETSAALLRQSSQEMTALSGQLSHTLKPMAASIAEGVTKLTAASAQLHTAAIPPPAPSEGVSPWFVHGLLVLIMFLVGALCGIGFEKSLTVDGLSKLGNKVDGIQHRMERRP